MPVSPFNRYLKKLKKTLPVIDCTAMFNQMGTDNLSLMSKTRFVEIKNADRSIFNQTGEEELGNIGFGVCYRKDFQYSFTNTVLLDYCITISPALGGNSSDFVFLTASNTCSKGCEAYLSYYAQHEPTFLIYDWSISGEDRWVKEIQYTDLSNYIFRSKVNQKTLDFIRVLNYSTLVSGRTWENKVCLFNRLDTAWNIIHQRTYDVTDVRELKVADLGFWGPIIETRQKNFGRLNPVGFADAMLYNDIITENARLTNSNTFIRTDKIVTGINLLFLDPNHTFLIA